MNLVVNSLWNGNVYLDGIELLGRVAEIEIPMPKRLMQDYKGLGMAARIELPVGFDKLEAAVKFSSFDYTARSRAVATAANHLLSVLGDIQVCDGSGQIADIPAQMNLTATFKDPGKIPMKAQQNVEIDATLTVYHVDLAVGGEQIFLFDSFSNQYVVNGVDQLANYRAAIGA